MTPTLQVLVAIGTLVSMGLGAWNAFAKVQMDLQITRARAEMAQKLSDHIIGSNTELANLRLEIAEKYVSREALDKTLADFMKLANKLGGQIRELQRVIDRELPQAVHARDQESD